MFGQALKLVISLLCLQPLSAAVQQPEPVQLRILSEKTFTPFRSAEGDEPHIRFAPSVALENGSDRRVFVPTDRNDAAVFVKLRIMDASGQEVRVHPCETRPAEQAGAEAVEPAEEKLLHLYPAFDVYVGAPGGYTAIVSLAVGEKVEQRKYRWIESARFDLEVRP